MKCLNYTITISLLFLTGCSYLTPAGRSFDEQKDYFNANSEELTSFSREFIDQTEIKNIAIRVTKNDECFIINEWSNCNSDLTWEKEEGLFPNLQTITAENRNQVLEKENISTEDFESALTFLIDYEFTGIGKSNEPETSYIDISDSRTTLRFFEQEDHSFEENNEYIRIEQLTPQWYIYVRDWN